MLKATAIEWAKKYAAALREDAEYSEDTISVSGMTGALFGDPGGCDSRNMLSNRRAWASILAELWQLESDLDTTDDEWWNGPKMDKEPRVGEPLPGEEGGFGYMLGCMGRGETAVLEGQKAAHKQWELEQQNKHWKRSDEAKAHIKNPKRRFKLSRRQK